MRLEKVLQVAKTLGFSQDETERMLEHYAALGCIIFYRALGGIEDLVIFDPKWLISAIASFIYDVKIHGSKRVLLQDSIHKYEANGFLPVYILLDSKQFWGNYSNLEKRYLYNLCLQKLLFSEFDDGKLIVATMCKNDCRFEPALNCDQLSLILKPGLPPGLFQRATTFLISKCADLRHYDKPEIFKDAALFHLEYRESRTLLFVKEKVGSDAIIIYFVNHPPGSDFMSTFIKVAVDHLCPRLKKDVHENISVNIFVLPGGNPDDQVKAMDLFDAQVRNDKTVMCKTSDGAARKLSSLEFYKNFLPLFFPVDLSLNDTFHGFLAHDWGEKSQGFPTHNLVAKLKLILEENGLRLWLDDDHLKGSSSFPNVIEDGLAKSKFVLVFLTKRYMRRANEDTNCANEFTSAILRPRDFIVPVILEEDISDAKTWPPGIVRYHLSHYYHFYMFNSEMIEANLPSLIAKLKDQKAKTNVPEQRRSNFKAGFFHALKRQIVHAVRNRKFTF